MEDILNLFLVALLIALTGFFVATEFAVVKVRSTRIDQLVEQGKPGAQAAKHVTSHLDEYLSACQLGITITALGLGWLGEPTVERLLGPLFTRLDLSESTSHILAFIIAFASVTFLHVVVGELAPKTVAIQKAEAVTLLFAKPIIWFYRIMYPFIFVLNGSARLLVGLFGIKPASEHDSSHSEEELRLILSESYESGEINQSEYSYVNRIFKFDERIAKEIMVPRTSMVTLDYHATLAESLPLMQEEQYTRYPVIDGNKDNIAGAVHIKEMMTKAYSGLNPEALTVKELTRPVIRVIETIPIHDLLLKMQKERTQIAVLVDEYGGTSGLVTIEDILEEIVGDIRDEFDEDEVKEIQKMSDDHYTFDSRVLISEVNDLIGVHLPEEDVDTIGGWFMTNNFDITIHDPIEIGGWLFAVIEYDDEQIGRIEARRV
ncbi:hemolysin family protein [Domibacillus sp. A3M-37]|uniref:hemolysin family protein n=1 Tax=Domibacillus TaxID=1433999 RepID=UPI000617AFCD|nr:MULTISPECIES: hemolysin family protein [Domibacillus]MCP3763570.1 hemolysin family protein [Domibacillus sp. A3M-37]